MADPASYQPDQLKDHDFDGIREYDNRLPNWLMAIFYVGLLWAGWYYAYYHFGMFGGGQVGARALTTELAVERARRAANDPGPQTDEQLLAAYTDKDRITAGAGLYKAMNCAQCHGTNAWGNVGPNLRDDFWVYGNSFNELAKTIQLGRPGGMPAHQDKLTWGETYDLAFYLVNLNQGTEKNADGSTVQGKGKQGNYQPFALPTSAP